MEGEKERERDEIPASGVVGELADVAAAVRIPLHARAVSLHAPAPADICTDLCAHTIDRMHLHRTLAQWQQPPAAPQPLLLQIIVAVY